MRNNNNVKPRAQGGRDRNLLYPKNLKQVQRHAKITSKIGAVNYLL